MLSQPILTSTMHYHRVGPLTATIIGIVYFWVAMLTRRALSLAYFCFICQPLQIASRAIFIRNDCPQPISWFVNGQSQGSLSPGASSNQTLGDDFSGLIYTPTNGANTNGVDAIKVGLYGPVSISAPCTTSLASH